MNPWDPAHGVDEALARALIGGQFPELADAELAPLGAGWDNTVWRAGDRVFRFPRREAAVGLIHVEARVLPRLAPRLPLPIPTPSHFGRPTDRFPFAFLGYPLLPGVTGDRLGLTTEQRSAVAPELGAFVRAVHDIAPQDAAALGAPRDDFRSDMAGAAARALKRSRLLEGAVALSALAELRAMLNAPPDDGSVAEHALLHGDLHARNLLFTDDGRLCAAIDWGDLCIGDPARDLGVVYTLLGPSARPAFWAAYGAVSAAMQRRARHTAATYAVHLVAYAADQADDALIAEAARALEHVLSY